MEKDNLTSNDNLINVTQMADIKKTLEELDGVNFNKDTGDVDIVRQVSLTIDEINSLSIDNLLDFKSQNVVIKINSTAVGDKFNIRWKEDGFDILSEKEEEIISAVKALMLKIELESASAKFYKKGLSQIVKLGDKISDKKLISKILGIDLKKPDVKDSTDDKNLESKSNPTGFHDIFNVINQVTDRNKSLNTLGGKVDYIVNKLGITDITEVIFVILTIAAIGEGADE